MKRPTHPTVAEAQRWVDECIAELGESVTKNGSIKTALRIDIRAASEMYEQPGLLVKFLDDLETQKLNKKLDKYDISRASNILCNLAAMYVSRGEPLPQPLCKLVVRVLLEAGETLARGTLEHRDGQIAYALAHLENWDFHLFPARDAPHKRGQTYGCDMLIEAFKKLGTNISSLALGNVWAARSRSPEILIFRKKKK
jgi:hypothetical protein